MDRLPWRVDPPSGFVRLCFVRSCGLLFRSRLGRRFFGAFEGGFFGWFAGAFEGGFGGSWRGPLTFSSGRNPHSKGFIIVLGRLKVRPYLFSLQMQVSEPEGCATSAKLGSASS